VMKLIQREGNFAIITLSDVRRRIGVVPIVEIKGAIIVSINPVRAGAKIKLVIDGNRGLDIAVVTPVRDIKNKNFGP